MIANLTSLAIMIAAMLFALSIPLGDSDAARTLRRAAAFAFVMAFLPAIFVCVVGPLFRPGRTTGASIQTFLAICGGLAILAVFALAAYGFLDIRSRARTRQPSAHGERVRYAKRRPSDHAGEDHEEDGDT